MLLWLLACTPDPAAVPSAAFDPVRIGPGEAVDAVPWGDGAAISWVEDDGQERTARVVALGANGALSDPTDLPADDPVAGLARKPRLAADGTRLLAVWSTGDPRQSAVTLAEAPTPSGPFTTVRIATGSADSAVTFVDQPDVHLSPDGEAWVGFKAEVDHPTVELRLAREASGWVPTPVTPSGGVPCECCPHVLRFLPGGDPWLLLRGNEANLREIHEARFDVAEPALAGRDLSLAHTTQVSRTGWWVQGCPFDGPDGAPMDAESRLVTWVDPTSGASRAWFATTDDDGTTWSDARPVFGDDGRLDQQPTVTLLADGRIAVAVDDYWSGTSVLVGPDAMWRDGQGAAADDPAATVLRPSRPLWDAELVPFGDGLLIVGVDEDDVVWAEALP